MKKTIHRAICLFFAVLVLCVCFPVSVFAVDPVSAGVMANAFAQAIAAYGASNGVAMTFDVTNTNGIGESVHELWKDFREGTQDADDYASLAAALFPDLYYKASVAVGTAADVYTVGYNISSEYAEEFDNFYNWLLSGPAEMTKVDNQYFQFSQAQIGANSTPLHVFSGNPYIFNSLPIYNPSDSWDTIYSGSYSIYQNANYPSRYIKVCGSSSNDATSSDFYLFGYYDTSYSPSRYCIVVSTTSRSNRVYRTEMLSSGVAGNTYSGDGLGVFHNTPAYSVKMTATQDAAIPLIPLMSDESTAWAYFNDYLSGNAPSDTIGVKSYGNDGVATFPDTDDPNYQATAKQIPSTYPWDNSLYGDGTGALSDAQAGAIAEAASDALADDGVLTLADTATPGPGGDDDDPPSNDPDDYLAVGLEDIFPFCIPFDIYNFLSALAAEPVAPHFTATLQFPQAIGGNQTIDIDFDSPTWNQLAQLLRLLELLAFIVGLALLTRSMFIRG